MTAAGTVIERVLVVMAHPDDVDFGAGGTVATWTDAGIEVHYCLVTDGDAGGFDAEVARADIAPLRRREQTAAAKELGVVELTFLGHPDGRLQPSLELRRDLARLIRMVRPQRVLAQSPRRNLDRIYASHPDHLAAGEAALCAVYPDARNPFAHPDLAAEGLDAWTVPEVWLQGDPEPDHAVDITATLDRKFAALRRHESQVLDPDAMQERIRGWTTAVAAQFGLGDGHHGEAFRVVATD